MLVERCGGPDDSGKRQMGLLGQFFVHPVVGVLQEIPTILREVLVLIEALSRSQPTADGAEGWKRLMPALMRAATFAGAEDIIYLRATVNTRAPASAPNESMASALKYERGP